MKLSILMPVYNEDQTVDLAIKRVLDVAYPCPVELVVVDDASTDRTPQILDGIDDERLTKLRHPVNMGKGAAIRTAAEAATGDFIQPFDADLEYRPEEIPRLLEPVLGGEAQVVFGSRMFGSHSAYSFWYVIGNKGLSTIANMLFNAYIADLETCCKLMPRDLYRGLGISSRGFGMEAEITGKLLARGIRPFEVPISYRARSREAGKKITWRDGVQAVWILSRIRLSARARRRARRPRPAGGRRPGQGARASGEQKWRRPASGRSRTAPTRPSAEPVAEFAAADAELAGTLANLGAASNYTAWIVELMEPHIGAEVLEVGAGHGTFTALLAQRATRVVATDPSETCARLLRTRFASDEAVEALRGSIEVAASRGPFDTAVVINVLEHIEDDEAALRSLGSLVRPGGRILLWAPALSLLYSVFDRKIGHYRRYSARALGALLTRAGWEVQDVRYVNSVGAAAWLVTARLLGKTPTSRGRVKIFDRYLVPVLRRIERRWRPPFGQSVLAVAARPGDQR